MSAFQANAATRDRGNGGRMHERRESIHGQWSSRMAFILAATGAAVGLGNIWKFPYITGENGGAAFVLVYLLCLLLMATPIMMTEIMLGRRSRRSPILGMQALAREGNASRHWSLIGWMGVASGFLILSYYAVIMGWALAYVFRAGSGMFEGMSAPAIRAHFEGFAADPEKLLLWHTVAMLLTLTVVARGVRGGLEGATRWMMPLLALILVALVGYNMGSPEAFYQALSFMFTPDFSRLTPQSVLIAMGHAFFTLSIGMGAIMAYGSYMPERVSIARTTLIIVAADTVIALMVGLVIFPVVFANGLEVGAGPGLIFQTLPIAFAQMPWGTMFGALFFIVVSIAAWTSAISMIEPAVAHLVEQRGFTRVRATLLLGAIIWAIGLLSVLSFNLLADWPLFGKTFFGLLDFVTSNIMLPLGGMLMALFAAWVMRADSTRQELGLGRVSFALWRLLAAFIAPVGVLLMLLSGLGLWQ